MQVIEIIVAIAVLLFVGKTTGLRGWGSQTWGSSADNNASYNDGYQQGYEQGYGDASAPDEATVDARTTPTNDTVNMLLQGIYPEMGLPVFAFLS